MKRNYTIHLCETCGVRRWVFRAWYEPHYENRDEACHVSFCSQGHPILFRVGRVTAIMREVMLPSIMDMLNNRNPLSSILRRS
jgi:hypothetical protein